MKEVLPFLTNDDVRLLEENVTTLRFQSEDVILKEGERRRAIFFIRSGFLRVEMEHLGHSIPVGHITAGEVFGESSFLETEGSNVSYVADEESEVDIIDGAYLQALLESQPGMATRFYRSIASLLLKRLKTMSRQVTAHYSWG